MNSVRFLLFNVAFYLLVSWDSYAQTIAKSRYTLEKKNTIAIPDGTEKTFIDYGNNLFFIAKDQITRISLATGLTNVQSLKAWQDIDQIAAINALKTVVFSQVQQQLCFTDNTLSAQGECLDLQTYEWSNVTAIATSKRPDMIWIYDELNSQISLFNFMRRQIIQSVSNLRGLHGLQETPTLWENEKGLWLATASGFVLKFDDYLNVVSQHQLDFQSMVPFGAGCFLLRDGKIYYNNLYQEEQEVYDLPFPTSYSKLHISGNQLIIEREKTLDVFIILAP
ncbi:MAG: hypothetical protein EB023_05530 [Flavobacteriia bacterium]|nr:hypothetical protein [Flavobacteriia bacterium]